MSTVLLEAAHREVRECEQKVAFVIIENQQSWTNHIRDLLATLCDGTAEIFVASSASQGVALVRDLRRQGREPALVTLDLHMGGTGENGDDFLRMVAPDGLPHILILSGTISDTVRKEIVEVIGIPCGEKNAALPSNRNAAAGAVLAERLEEAMQSRPAQPSFLQLDRLSTLVHEWDNLPLIDILIDEIKARAEDIGARNKEWLDGDAGEFKSLFVNPKLYTGNRAGNVHEYKNELGALVLRLEAGDLWAPMGLLDELREFLQSIITQYKQAHEKKEAQLKVDIVDTTQKLCHKLDMLYAQGERIDFLSELNEHILSIDPTLFRKLITNALMNALMHGKGQVLVTISDEGTISIANEVDPDFALTFTITDNTVKGQMPIESTHPNGSATGIRAMLDTVGKIPGGRMNLSQFLGRKGGEIQFGFFIESPSPDNGQSAKTLESREIGEQPEVIFLCHDGQPGASFSALAEIGSRHQHFLVPNLYIFKNGDNEDAPHVQSFLKYVKDNNTIFSRATLCVMHASTRAFKSVISRLQPLYPQLIFLPAADFPDMAFHYEYEEWEPSVEPSENVMTPDDVRHFIAPDDPATREEVLYSLYRKDYSPQVWQTLQNIAVRLSNDKLEKLKTK